MWNRFSDNWQFLVQISFKFQLHPVLPTKGTPMMAKWTTVSYARMKTIHQQGQPRLGSSPLGTAVEMLIIIWFLDFKDIKMWGKHAFKNDRDGWWEFSQTAGYNINMENSVSFLCASNKKKSLYIFSFVGSWEINWKRLCCYNLYAIIPTASPSQSQKVMQ